MLFKIKICSDLQSWPRNSFDRFLLSDFSDIIHRNRKINSTNPTEVRVTYWNSTNCWLGRGHEINVNFSPGYDRLFCFHFSVFSVFLSFSLQGAEEILKYLAYLP